MATTPAALMKEKLMVKSDVNPATMIGKVCDRLMALPGVQGVRVKIAKLEIFDDCEVAIRMETGQW